MVYRWVSNGISHYSDERSTYDSVMQEGRWDCVRGL